MRRRPAIYGASVVMSLFLLLTGVAGCTSQRTIKAATCPEAFTAAVVWTSRTARSSVVQFFDGDRVVAEVPFPARNVATSDQGPVYHDGIVGFLSTGDPYLTDARLVTMSLATCEVTLQDLGKPGFNVGSYTEGFLTVGNINGYSYLRKFPAGSAPTTTPFQGEVITAMEGVGDYVYAESNDMTTNATSLIVLNANDLSLVKRVPLPMIQHGEISLTLTVADGKVILPMGFTTTPTGDVEDNRLIVVDQADWSVHTIELGQPSPYLLRSIGDTVYVAHTSMNEGFHPWSHYRYVSVVDMTDETSSAHQLGNGILSLDVTSTSLAVVSGPDDEETQILHTYAMPGFTPLVTVTLQPPAGVPDSLAAQVFLPQS